MVGDDPVQRTVDHQVFADHPGGCHRFQVHLAQSW